MKILLTGANGYIGKRLLPSLVAANHQVVCCVRDKNRFVIESEFENHVEVIEVDFLKESTLKNIPKNIDGAYYLIHSMSANSDYEKLEQTCAQNFVETINSTKAKHVIYLSGIVNEDTLSKHLSSRKAVEDILNTGTFHCTTLRAGIIIGSGSASFEIIRDLVEKLPVMITPKWINTKCQPIGIRDVILFLTRCLFNEATYDQSFDIGGKDILTYKEMLKKYAEIRGLRLYITTVPVMTPKLSSYWLYFITSTSYQLATALVSSMKVEVVCAPSDINQIAGVEPIGYEASLERTFEVVKSDLIVSSWKDSLVSGVFKENISTYLEVPTNGVFTDKRKRKMADREVTMQRLWRIGGETGWYHADWLWELRGVLDQLFGGVGLRRGRTSVNHIAQGDAIDFWRVLYANKDEGRLLLFAEMKLPGEAWLEFKIIGDELHQTATFRPKGIWGRMYWYSVFPFHGEIFPKMLKKITAPEKVTTKKSIVAS